MSSPREREENASGRNNIRILKVRMLMYEIEISPKAEEDLRKLRRLLIFRLQPSGQEHVIKAVCGFAVNHVFIEEVLPLVRHSKFTKVLKFRKMCTTKCEIRPRLPCLFLVERIPTKKKHQKSHFQYKVTLKITFSDLK